MKWTELTPKARESFLSTYSADYFADCTLEYYKEDPDVAAKGFDIDEIFYSGFSSQGDGASWKGRVKLGDYIKHHWTGDDTAVKREILLAMLENADMANYIQIATRGSYCHSNTMYVKHGIETYFGPGTTIDAKHIKENMFFGANVADLLEAIGGDDTLEAFCEEMLTAARELADEIYAALEKEYDYQHSEECVAELAAANDWEFDEEGEMI